MSIAQAKREALQLAGEIAAGIDVYARARTKRRIPELDDLFKLYEKDAEKRGKRTTAKARGTYERWLGTMPKDSKRTKPPGAVHWGGHRINAISHDEVTELIERMEKLGLTGPTINKVTGLLSAMYAFAKRKHLYEGESPTSGFERAPERERARFLNREELPKFFAALEQTPEIWRDLFQVLLSTGYRRSAVSSMAWRDIDLERAVWRVPGEKAKNGDDITLPLTGAALEILQRRWLQQPLGPWVFPGRSKAGHITSPKAQWAQLLKRAGLDDLRMHDLRRSLGSWLAMTGHSLIEIGRVLGHKDMRSTQVYAHLQLDHVRAASTKAQLVMFPAKASAEDDK